MCTGTLSLKLTRSQRRNTTSASWKLYRRFTERTHLYWAQWWTRMTTHVLDSTPGFQWWSTAPTVGIWLPLRLSTRMEWPILYGVSSYPLLSALDFAACVWTPAKTSNTSVLAVGMRPVSANLHAFDSFWLLFCNHNIKMNVSFCFLQLKALLEQMETL